MDLILNDYSISKQFSSLDNFLDSILEHTLPMLSLIYANDNNLYKTYGAYDLKFFDDITINKLIQNPMYNAYPEITSLKRMLCALIEEPFWEDNPSTDCEAEYECECVGKFSGIEPNCFSEAFERGAILFSFEHNDFKCFKIHVLKNIDKLEINNFYNKASIVEYLLNEREIGFSEFLLSKKYPKEIAFYSRRDIYCADEPYINGQLNNEDVISIQKDFVKSLEYISQGNLNSRFTDSISYKGYTYYEFRCSLSSSREFRIYYYLHKGKYVYFNSIIKKTNTIDNATKDKTIELIKEYIDKSQ